MATPKDTSKRIKKATESDVPSLYFNGFVNAFSAGDIMCVIERNGAPVGILNMSYTVAKTLSASLGTLITTLEDASDRPIMTTHEIGVFLADKPDTPPKKKQSRRKSKNA